MFHGETTIAMTPSSRKSMVAQFFQRETENNESEELQDTGKSFSEALILASTNPQYDKRLFIELRVQYMKITSSEHVVYIKCLFLF